jgi:tRNA (guanine37-N1)-methyltransferase
LATDEISIGDYVLSGGELPAAVLMEAVTRLIPGALGNEESPVQESFAGALGAVAGTSGGILDCPQYTRPAEFRGMSVPEILLSGNHEEIRKWRRRRALEKTWRKRPELLRGANLNAEDRAAFEAIQREALEPVVSRK